MTAGFRRRGTGAAVAALIAAAAAALMARALPLSSVEVPLGPVGWAPRSFQKVRVSLPFESTGAPLHVRLRAHADARSIVAVELGDTPVGELRVEAGAPGTYVLEVPAPAPGRRLDLALAVRARPLAGGASAAEPLLVLDGFEIDSPRGLAFGPVACALVGVWPLAGLGLAWLLRAAPGRALGAALLAGALASLAARVVPLPFVGLGPFLIGAVLSAGLASRLPLAVGTEMRPGESVSRGWMWAAGLAALPAVETSALLATLFGRTLLDHVPGLVNDAIDYWLEAQAFARAGLRGGYFTVDERAAPASFSHFGTHGPFFPMLHGAFGRVVGWHRYSIPLFQLALLTAALVLFARRMPTDGRGRFLAALCLATFWPVLFLAPTSMQEGLHFAVAVLLAAALGPLLAGREASRGARAGLVAVLVLGCLIRPSWGLLLPPAFVLALGPASWRRGAMAAAAGVALGVVLLAVFAFTAAPWGREEFFFLRVARLQEGASALIAQAVMNGRRFVMTGTHLHLLGRFLVVALALACSALALRTRRRELVFHAYNLGSILVASLFTYAVGVGNEFRVMSPHLLLTVLLLATSSAAVGRRLAAFVLLVQLANPGPFLQSFRQLRETFDYDASRIAAFGAASRRVMAFDARQDAWCNTLVSVSSPYFYSEMVALPPGIGVTMLFGSAPERAPRSRYVLVDPDAPRGASPPLTLTPVGPDRVRLTVGAWRWLNLEPIAATPVGQLYRNVDAVCPDLPPLTGG